jgi:hypothetical protein
MLKGKNFEHGTHVNEQNSSNNKYNSHRRGKAGQGGSVLFQFGCEDAGGAHCDGHDGYLRIDA